MNALSSPVRSLRTQRVTHLTRLRIVRSEWSKFFSLRSTSFALVAGALMLVLFGAIASYAIVHDWKTMSAMDRATFDALRTSLRGIAAAQLPIGVLGVLWISGEYSSGLIRSTLTAVPRRLPILGAKSGVLATAVFLTTAPGALVAFFVSQSILDSKRVSIAFSQPGVARSVIGGALYLTVLALFGFALGALIRSTAGGIAALVAAIFVVPALVDVLGPSWTSTISPYLPTNAGEAITAVDKQPHTLAPWAGFGVFVAYTLGLLLLAAIRLRRRDV